MDDHIWGIFKSDNQTKQIWNVTHQALQGHSLQTDIVYADPDYPLLDSYVNVYQPGV
jgi:hypothetical protein